MGYNGLIINLKYIVLYNKHTMLKNLEENNNVISNKKERVINRWAKMTSKILKNDLIKTVNKNESRPLKKLKIISHSEFMDDLEID